MKDAPTLRATSTWTGERGMTLVELLVAIGILAIITAIAVPNLSHATNAAGKTSAQRNAQSLVSVSNAAAAAGVNFIDPGEDMARTVANIVAGEVAAEGILKGSRFGLSSLSETSQEAAARFLRIEGGSLVYVAEGGN